MVIYSCAKRQRKHPIVLFNVTRHCSLFSSLLPRIQFLVISYYLFNHTWKMYTKTLNSLVKRLEDIEISKNSVKKKKLYTSPSIAGSVLHTAQTDYDDITNKRVANLGCGSGMLCIGAALLNADFCTGFDINPSALSLCSKNAVSNNVSNICDFILCDVKDISKSMRRKKFDTVIMSPPFGGKNFELEIFLKTAFYMATHAVYLLHKTKSRQSVLTYACKYGIYGKVISQLRFELPKSYKFHKVHPGYIEVDLIRFVLKRP